MKAGWAVLEIGFEDVGTREHGPKVETYVKDVLHNGLAEDEAQELLRLSRHTFPDRVFEVYQFTQEEIDHREALGEWLNRPNSVVRSYVCSKCGCQTESPEGLPFYYGNRCGPCDDLRLDGLKKEARFHRIWKKERGQK